MRNALNKFYMPQVSKRPLKNDVRDKMLGAFFESVLKINDEKVVYNFFEDLFTPTEKIMISKRLSAAFFLDRGYTYDAIGEILKLSHTTINTIRKTLVKSGEGYRAVFRLIEKSPKMSLFFEKFDAGTGASRLPIKGSRSSHRR